MSNRSFFRRAASLSPAALKWLAAALLSLVATGALLAALAQSNPNNAQVNDYASTDATLESGLPTGWTAGRFRLARPDAGGFTDPAGQLFYVRGMTYAYGPEGSSAPLTAADVISQLNQIKALGFNTVNLYPRSGFNTEAGLQADFLPEILTWADQNSVAVYVRVWYRDVPQFPDYMDAQYRQQAKASLDAVIELARPHPSLLAIDLDQRWLFDVDYQGARRFGAPRWMTHTLAYLPTWLEDRFGVIKELNEVWGKDYLAFADVLSDAEIISDGQVVDLDRRPWRLDLIEYTLWVMDDFMTEVIGYARGKDADRLFTYTNDRAEVIPFPLSSQANSGIDFISPVHYNAEADFYRDWMARAKLTQETLWQRGLYGLPAFVRESGWRTETLAQDPPDTGYAWSLSETHKAELYLRQATLMAVYPWIAGWSYFKWYDKPIEGDFGFVNDDGAPRPIAELGGCINPAVAVNRASQRSPQVWVYYPTYALTTPYPAYEHYKTLIELLEYDFFDAYEERLAEAWSRVSWPLSDCAAVTDSRLFTDLTDVFAQRWRPAAFTARLVCGCSPLFLAGRALESLSLADREVLAVKRTMTFGPVGTSDERYHLTTPWYAEAAGVILPADAATPAPDWPASGPAVRILRYPLTACAGRSVDVAVAWRGLSASDNQNYKLIVQLENWDVSPGVVYWREFTGLKADGALTVTLDVPAQVLTYTQPIGGARYVAAFISKTTGWSDTLTMTATPKSVTIQTPRWLTVTTGVLTCPVRAAWTVSPSGGTFHTLATFTGGELNGAPAVVRSADSRHVAFLYDVLAWQPVGADTDEAEKARLEAGLACHGRLLDGLIASLNSPCDLCYMYLPLVLREYRQGFERGSQ